MFPCLAHAHSRGRHRPLPLLPGLFPNTGSRAPGLCPHFVLCRDASTSLLLLEMVKPMPPLHPCPPPSLSTHTPIHAPGDVWLVGGASNSGGAVLRRFFSDEQLKQLTPRLRPEAPTRLAYYPLPAPGERFPVADPELQPRMEPRPADDAVFLQGGCAGTGVWRIRGVEEQRGGGGGRMKLVGGGVGVDGRSERSGRPGCAGGDG